MGSASILRLLNGVIRPRVSQKNNRPREWGGCKGHARKGRKRSLKVLVLQREDLLGAELLGAGGPACGRLFGFGGFRR